jgi:Kef-type K+ transport system membrane component KefB
MGRIPGFTNAIFPAVSIPNLTLVANIGLVLFLFLVGLEADFSIFRKNAKAGIAISVFGLAIPFGAGAAVSYGVYHKFVNTEAVNFGIFLLFIGTAMA